MKEIIKEIAGQITIVDIFIYATGLLVIGFWLYRTSFGIKALINAPDRRNDMSPFLAFLPFFFWALTAWLLAQLKINKLPELSDWQVAFADNLILCLSSGPVIVISFIIAGNHFARGIKGFGLNSATVVRDFGAALLNLLAAMPMVLTVLLLTIFMGKLLFGPDFKIPRHEELKEIIAFQQWQVRAIIVFSSIIIAPLTEEILFRGMLQTVFRSYTQRTWRAIIMTSLIFAVYHFQYPLHWPALFVFGVVLGYAYEKSGSLFRAIFLHSIFNAISVFSTLGQ